MTNFLQWNNLPIGVNPDSGFVIVHHLLCPIDDFLEAVYLKKPILVNRYSTFVKDIEPLGFKLPLMDGFLSKKTVQEVKAILESPEARDEMVNHNFKIACRHYSFTVLRNQLDLHMRSLLDDEEACLGCTVKNYRNIVYLDAGKDRLNGVLHDRPIRNASIAEG